MAYDERSGVITAATLSYGEVQTDALSLEPMLVVHPILIEMENG